MSTVWVDPKTDAAFPDAAMVDLWRRWSTTWALPLYSIWLILAGAPTPSASAATHGDASAVETYLYPTEAFALSVAPLCKELNASLGLHLGLEHYVALTSAGTEHPAARRFAGHVAEGKQWLELEVTRALGWDESFVQLRALRLRVDHELRNAYRLNCTLDASYLLGDEVPSLLLEVDTEEVYDWFRYAGYLRWAKYILQQLERGSSSVGDGAVDRRGSTTLVDLAGGAGWLSLLVKAALPNATVVYTDLSASACAVAEKAMQQNAVGSVELRQGDFFEPLEGVSYDFIFSYPPQVPDADSGGGDGRGSPELALRAADPMEFLERFCREVSFGTAGWLGVTWELVETTMTVCCQQGWNVSIPEAFQQDINLPAVLLELRRPDTPRTAPGDGADRRACAEHARRAAGRCREWLMRQGQLQRSAEMGHPAAQTKWGIQLMQRSAEWKDASLQQEAIRWYKRAAQQGEMAAATRLGFLYLTGDGVKKNAKKGLDYLWRASLQGEPGAMFGLAETEALAGHEEAAKQWYRRSAARGFTEAKRQLGLFLLSRSGEHSEEAFEQLKEAAAEGDAKAHQLLRQYFFQTSQEL
ncbi:unnamed protein product [Durusdinium trenchii]|uniref:Methyltransferase small domain-containing protein n=1 Tax=Durusdinium trenchii TaxID=1381693 RepID=A0ABP0LZZ9_9DINO